LLQIDRVGSADTGDFRANARMLARAVRVEDVSAPCLSYMYLDG